VKLVQNSFSNRLNVADSVGDLMGGKWPSTDFIEIDKDFKLEDNKRLFKRQSCSIKDETAKRNRHREKGVVFNSSFCTYSVCIVFSVIARGLFGLRAIHWEGFNRGWGDLKLAERGLEPISIVTFGIEMEMPAVLEDVSMLIWKFSGRTLPCAVMSHDKKIFIVCVTSDNVVVPYKETFWETFWETVWETLKKIKKSHDRNAHFNI
jgi:hypothetical protein